MNWTQKTISAALVATSFLMLGLRQTWTIYLSWATIGVSSIYIVMWLITRPQGDEGDARYSSAGGNLNIENAIGRDNLLTWLNRYPEYRPVTQMGAGSWVWTATDIERVRNGRTETRSRKPHRRKKKSV